MGIKYCNWKTSLHVHTLGLIPSCGGEGGERVPGFTLFVHGPNCSKRQISDIILYQYSFCAGQLSCDQQLENQLCQGLEISYGEWLALPTDMLLRAWNQHCCGVDGLLPQQWTLISHCHLRLTVTTELL